MPELAGKPHLLASCVRVLHKLLHFLLGCLHQLRIGLQEVEKESVHVAVCTKDTQGSGVPRLSDKAVSVWVGEKVEKL